MSKTEQIDIVVIGAGPGGYAAAFRAADLGKSVLLIDKDKTLGGVCLNRGCIPSKALLHISRGINEVAHLSKAGVSFGPPTINIDTIRAYKEKIVSQLNSGISQLAKQRKVKTVSGTATFLSNKEISIETERETIQANFDKCIIAAGSTTSMIPGAPKDHPGVLTSKTALDLVDVPKNFLVIGGGVIGVELGQVYSALGSQVTVVEYLPDLIPGADPDIVKPLYRKLKTQFKSILTSSKVTQIIPSNDKLKISIESNNVEQKHIFDKVLVAIGRKPNIDLLNIEVTDIVINEKGFINVDVYQRTSVKHIFAIGDITGNPMLAHKASHEGKVAAEVASGVPSAMDARAIPSVVYTDPEIAWVGLTEIDAKEKNIDYDIGVFPWAASGKAMILNASQGKTKILFDPDTKRVLGAGVVGPSAGDLISEAVLAIEMGADVEDIGLTVHPHPTLGETFGAAAEMYSGTITDLFIPQKGAK